MFFQALTCINMPFLNRKFLFFAALVPQRASVLLGVYKCLLWAKTFLQMSCISPSYISPSRVKYQPFKVHVSALQRSCISPSKVMYQPFKAYVSALQSSCIIPSKITYQPFKGHVSALESSCISPSKVMY